MSHDGFRVGHGQECVDGARVLISVIGGEHLEEAVDC